MYAKSIYVLVDILAILDLIIIYRLSERIKKSYAKWIRCAFIVGIVAMLANICIALAPTAEFASVSYCFYFASINWILFSLDGFCMDYTDHRHVLKVSIWFIWLLSFVDSVSLFLNFVFGHHFYIYEYTNSYGVRFFKTGFNTYYYLHLATDYILVAVMLYFLIYKIIKTDGIYRAKYIIILSVLLLVIVLNIAYMAFSLDLDASVVFYALAGTLIYFSISIFVPRSLMNATIGQTIDDMNEGLVLFQIGDKCIYANSFMKKHFDLDITNCTVDSEPLASVFKKARITGKPTEEIDYTVKYGDPNLPSAADKHYRIRYNRLFDKKNRATGSYCLVEDTSEQVYLMNALQEAKDQADEANKAKSTFLANMSHEIRTPLNSVLGLNEMILRTSTDNEVLEYSEGIKMSGDTLLSLINDILDFSKIEAERMELNPEEYNTLMLVRETILSFEAQATAKDLYITVKMDETIPKGLIGDAQRIKQILSNLISNAIKYTKEGGVTINVHHEKTGYDTCNLLVDVTDTGIGIAEKDLPNIFDAFLRINETKNANIQGTGLGLAITKELITIMNGNIQAESELGKGTTFTFSIPQTIINTEPVGPYENIHFESTHKYKVSFTAPNARILIVDDVMVNLKVVEALLKKTKLKIDKANGGSKAISLCQITKYDVILLDHRMPAPDGVETFNTISRIGLNTNTPVIVLTANALNGAKEEYTKLGFTDYLSKPIKSDELEEMLIKYLPKDKVELS